MAADALSTKGTHNKSVQPPEEQALDVVMSCDCKQTSVGVLRSLFGMTSVSDISRLFLSVDSLTSPLTTSCCHGFNDVTFIYHGFR